MKGAKNSCKKKKLPNILHDPKCGYPSGSTKDVHGKNTWRNTLLGRVFFDTSCVNGNCSLVYEKSAFRKRKYSKSVIIHTKDRKRITKFEGILEGIPCASIEHPRHLLFRLFHGAHNNTVYNWFRDKTVEKLGEGEEHEFSLYQFFLGLCMNIF